MSDTLPKTAASPPAASPHSRGALAIARLRDLALVPPIIAVGIVGYIVNPVFLQSDNIVNVLQSMSEISIVVLAQTMVLITGKMDLSLESTFGLAPGIAAWLIIDPAISHGLGIQVLPPALAIPVVLLVGVVVGAFNGLLIVRFGLNGFIVTLGMLIVLRGLLTGVSGGKTFFALPSSMTYLGSTTWLTVPASVWISLLLFAAGVVVLGFTRTGRALYAIGGNVDAARAAGIRTDRILWITLVVASMLAALAGLLMSGRLAAVPAAQGNGAIFQVFAAAVIGGVSLNGGKGTVFGAFTGVLLLFMIINVLTLAGVPAQWTSFLNGAVILVALVVSRITGGKAQT